MTNNTIPNVPRALLERAATSIEQRMCIQCEGVPCCMPESLNTLSDIRALLSAPSPAGVDGLGDTAKLLLPALRQYMHNDGSGLLAGYDLETTQAIIDGLRGEVEVMTQHANNYSLMFEECAEERDHLAQCLKFARTTMAVIADNANLRGVEYRSLVTEVKRIDAALAAVCAAAPNIATTSEHSSQPERDPCPMCIKGGICNTPTCGRLRAMPKAY